MNSGISNALFSRLSKFVETRMGLHFPENHWKDMEHGISSAASEFGFKDAKECVKFILSSQLQKHDIEILASHLTVGETYFFREKRSFEILEYQILPEIIYSRRENDMYLRIWSAGCSTGEEPYSIAILLKRMIPDIKDWNVTILATDINSSFIQKAEKGVYGKWSFREAPAWAGNYFKNTKNGFEILPDIKKMVTFSYHNLAEDTYPSLFNNTNAMDIIFCRNVLMYFSEERRKQVVNSLFHSLVDGGWLIVSPVEASNIIFSQFVAVNYQDTYLYKKKLKGKPPEKRLFADEKIKTVLPYDAALSLYSLGKFEQAVEKILPSMDHDVKAMALLARSYANQGKLKEAEELCEKALTYDRLNPHYYYLHATILQEQGHFEEAVKSLKRAIYLDHNFVLAYFSLGNLSKRQGKSGVSEKYFNNALMILKNFGIDEVLPESEGITAGRLSEIIISIKMKEKLT